MKRIKDLYIIIVTAAMIIACSNDNSAPLNENEKDILGTTAYEIEKIEDFTAKEISDIIFQAVETTGVDAAKIFLSNIAAREQQLQKELGLQQIELGYRKINYLYNSVDQFGNPVTLSSALYFNSYKAGNEWHNITTDKICLVEHYTITSDLECPTKSYPIEPHMLGNAVVVMPDYLGYGSSADKLHPYLNHNIAAINSVDALDAAYAICRDYYPGLLSKDWTMSVLGASQGGSNALAVHKYIETTPTLADNWNFTHSNCAAGAYSPVHTFNTYIEWEWLEYPVVIPMVLKSMIASNPDIMSKWNEEDFYSAEYIKIKPQIDTMLAGKRHTTDEINNIFFNHFSTSQTPGLVSIKDILSADALNKDSEMRKALFACLKNNDLTTGWQPKHPIKLYHSKNDKVVPYINAQEATSLSSKNVTLRTVEDGGHVSSCAMWMFSILLGGN